MPAIIMPGLTPEEASHICMEQCRALCCRGPLILELTKGEAQSFREHAGRLGVGARVSARPDGGGWVRFSDYETESCPMLDPDTNACRIYQDRPQRCRDFPERPTPGCAISGYAEPPNVTTLQ